MDYKEAGVDIEAGDQLVQWLKQNKPKEQPFKENVLSGIGGFAALFSFDFKKYEEPLLVSSTDGIGTKLKCAIDFNSYHSVAQDLVAMCVNDLICSGAMPLFFLDYYATGKLNLDHAKDLLGGIQDACVEAECALIGGETAEMPGLYHNKDFDCAGFSVGVVDKPKTLGAHLVKEGDVLIGVESNGFHSNGYSLIRKMFEKDKELWKEKLTAPTHLYVKLAKSLFESMNTNLHAMAHITGGGLDNLLRVLPDGLSAHLNSWDQKEEYLELKKRSELSWLQMLKTFNCGLGLILVVDAASKESCMADIEKFNFKAYDLGELKKEKGPANWYLNNFGSNSDDDQSLRSF